MRTEDYLKKIARGVRNDDITTSNDVEHEDMLSTFRAMRDVTLGDLERWENDGIHLIFEWNKNKTLIDEDGNLVFDTYELITHEEYEFVKTEIELLNEKAKKQNAKKRRSNKTKSRKNPK